MDSRHVSSEMKALNSVIRLIHRQLVNHYDLILVDAVYLNTLREMLQCLYDYCHIKFDPDNYFSFNNFKHADPVILPSLNIDIPPDASAFDPLIEKLIRILHAGGVYQNKKMHHKLSERMHAIQIARRKK